jgi:hypothetical protein
VKVVTLRQPEATAVVLGLAKRLWRGRPLAYRGPLLIHAAADRPRARDRAKHPELDPDTLLYGAILGVVRVIGCVPDEAGCGYEWYLDDPRPLPEPYPCKGQWGLWRPPAGLLLGQRAADAGDGKGR